MIVYVLRHEQRDSLDPRFHSPLTPGGRLGAEELATALSALNITVVYTSPFLRAVQTAHPFCEAHGRLMRVDHALYESLDNPVFDVSSSHHTWRDLPSVYHAAIDTSYVSSTGAVPLRETFDEVRARVRPFVRGLLERHRKGAVLLVTHLTTANAIRKEWGAVCSADTGLAMGEWVALRADEMHSTDV